MHDIATIQPEKLRRLDEPKKVERFRPGPHINRALAPLHKLDNWHGPLALFEDFATIAVAVAVSTYANSYCPAPVAMAVYLVAAILIGACQRGLATILHEAAHKAAAKSRVLNWVLGGPLSGWAIGQLYAAYFRSHVLWHHPKLGHVKNDPDTENYVSQGLLKQSPKWFVIRNMLVLLSGAKAIVQLPYVLKHRLLPKGENMRKKAVWLEILGFVIFWAAVIAVMAANGWLVHFALFWVIPYLTTFQAVGWVIETSEHFPIVFTSSKEVERTRNRNGNVIERVLFGRHGEWGHLIHHLRPGIPFWRMKEAHRILLQDEDYRRSNARYSGLFTRSEKEGQTIWRAMSEELGTMQSAMRDHKDA